MTSYSVYRQFTTSFRGSEWVKEDRLYVVVHHTTDGRQTDVGMRDNSVPFGDGLSDYGSAQRFAEEFNIVREVLES